MLLPNLSQKQRPQTPRNDAHCSTKRSKAERSHRDTLTLSAAARSKPSNLPGLARLSTPSRKHGPHRHRALLAFLDVAAGGSNASVSKAWRSVCGSWALWHDLSQPLRKWRNIAVDAKLHPREFCRLSIADSKRTSLTRDELCSQTWRFRFKRAAGEEWLAVDPYWTDNNPATITFTADGTTERAGTWELEVEVKWRWGHARKARRQPGVAGGERLVGRGVVVDGRDVPTSRSPATPSTRAS